MDMKTIAVGFLALGLLTQSVLLWLQYDALLRNGHSLFRVLCLSSICGILYLVVGFIPHLVPMTLSGIQVLYLAVGAPLLIVQSGLGIWGAAALFSSYTRMAQIISQGSDDEQG